MDQKTELLWLTKVYFGMVGINFGNFWYLGDFGWCEYVLGGRGQLWVIVKIFWLIGAGWR